MKGYIKRNCHKLKGHRLGQAEISDGADGRIGDD